MHRVLSCLAINFCKEADGFVESPLRHDLKVGKLKKTSFIDGHGTLRILSLIHAFPSMISDA